jgi:hypothetical protein
MEILGTIITAAATVLATILPPLIQRKLPARTDDLGHPVPRLIPLPVLFGFGVCQGFFAVLALIAACDHFFEIIESYTPPYVLVPNELVSFFVIEFLLLSGIAGMLYGFAARGRGSLLGATVGYVGGGIAVFLALHFPFLSQWITLGFLWIAIQGAFSFALCIALVITLSHFAPALRGNAAPTTGHEECTP